MKNLLTFELHKLLRQKSFYICLALLLVFSYISLLLAKAIQENDPSMVLNASGLGAMLSAFSNSNFTMIGGIFLALFVCSDFDGQTIKNVYARGFSKNYVFISKWIVGIFAILIMFIITLFFSFIAGNTLFEGIAEEGNYIGLYIGQFLLAIAYASFVFSVSIIVKRVGVSIALAILGPSLISTVLSLADAFLKIENFSIARYWLDGFAKDLVSVQTDSSRLVVCIVLSAIYSILFVFAGFFVNKKMEN